MTATQPLPPPRRSRRWLWAALAVLAISSAALFAYCGRWVSIPDVPAVNLDGADPQLALIIDAAQHAVEENPYSPASWGQLAIIFHANGFSSAANVCYDAAMRLDPQNPQWPYLCGNLLYDGPGGPEASLPLLSRAAELSPPQSLARLRLADNLLELGRLEDAEAAYQDLLAANSADPLAHLGLSRLAVVRQEYREALQHLERIADDPLTRQQACAIRASVHERLGERALAERERQKLQSWSGNLYRRDDPLFLVMEAEVGLRKEVRTAFRYRQENRLTEMHQLLVAAVERYPRTVEAWESLADGCDARGDLQGAERALRKCVELAPKSAAHHLRLGKYYLTQRQLPAALESLSRAVELNPRDGRAHFSLGICRERMDDPDGAALAYRQAQRYLPDDPEIKQRLKELSASGADDGTPD